MSAIRHPDRAAAPPPAGRRSATTHHSSARPLLPFAVIALLTGWAMLATPLLLHLPLTPFVFLTTGLALFVPAIVLTHRTSGTAGVRALLRDAWRLPRLRWGATAVLALPGLVWAAAALVGGARPLTPTVIGGFLVNVLGGVIIINIWEEIAWTGFVQRRAMARWGLLGGSLVTALLFAGIHLPLAFADARTPEDVLRGVGLLLAIGIGLRLLIAYLDTRSGRSLLAVGLLHASFNASSDLVEPSADWVRLLTTAALAAAVTVAVTTASRRSTRQALQSNQGPTPAAR